MTALHQTLASAFLDATDESEQEIVHILARLVEIYGNVNQRDRLGKSVLHLAAQLGLSHVVTMLIEMGADPLSADLQGNLPIHYAIEYK